MAAGQFGAIGYDMVRLVERLPNVNPAPLGQPDGIMTRPTIVAIFDSIVQEIVLVTSVRPSGATAQQAWDAAQARLDRVVADLAQPLERGPDAPPPHAQAPFTSPVTRQ